MTLPATNGTHRGAHAVWLVALLAYLMAVFHRSSLAVAGLEASDRFGIAAAQLSTFVMLQLLIYAGMQVPVGLMLDRFGPRALMLTGTVILALAQTTFALVDTYSLALVARMFVGLGDALTFVCLLRLINSWYGPQSIPQVTIITGPIGQLGAIIAAVPMTWALGTWGWTNAYLAAAVFSLVTTVAVALVVRDDPSNRTRRGAPLSWSSMVRDLGDSWAEPGNRLGFWMHFTCPPSSNMLGLLWGFPFFVQGEGTSEVFAGTLLTIMVVAVMSAGPLLGRVVARHPWHRSTLVLGVVWSMVAVWTVVLLWPGPAPAWLLVVLVVVAGIGGPTSMVGFDLVRTSNPPERLGAAMGIANQAGFIATLALVIGIGLVLDWQTPGSSSDYTPRAFQLAMCVQYAIWALGLIQIWRYRRQSRAAYPHFRPS